MKWHLIFLNSLFLTIICFWLPVSGTEAKTSVDKKLTDVRNEINDVRLRYEEAKARYLSPLVVSADYTPPLSERMEKARFYFNSGDYISSGSLYYSIVMSMKEKNEIWEEALFKLAESLYNNRNYISATRYHEMLITTKPDSKYKFDSLKRLIASSYRLGNYSSAKNYYSEFIDAGYDISADQELAYYLGKSLFFDEYIKEAFNVFATIKEGGKYYLQSLYFLGVIEMRHLNKEVALGYFEKVLQVDKDKSYHSYAKIKELALLASARIAFELGDLMKAVRYYLMLDKRSEHFAEAYYELCWTYIRRSEYQKAIDALRLIKFIEPDSIIVPKAEMLEGSLLIKLGRFGEAMVLFNAMVEKYGAIKEELYSIDSRSFAADQSPGHGIFAPYSPFIRSLLRDNKKYMNAILLYDIVVELEKEIERTEKLERRLGSVITSKNAAAVFPPLKEGSNIAIALQNRLVSARNSLVEMKKESAWAHLDDAEKKIYEELEEQKNKLIESLEGIPLTADQIEERTAEYAKKIILMEEELHRITIQVKTFNQQLDGIKSYYMRHSGDSVDSRLSERIDREKEEINKVIESLNTYKKIIEEEKNRLVLGGDMVSRVIIARNSLSKIIEEQSRLLSGAEVVTPEVSTLTAEINELEASLENFYSKLNEVVGDIIGKIRLSYENERNNLNEYRSELYEIKREITEMASLAMYSNINRVRTVFSDLVINADLGIIDVAWEKKDQSSNEILRLRTQRAQEIRSLYTDLENIE